MKFKRDENGKVVLPEISADLSKDDLLDLRNQAKEDRAEIDLSAKEVSVEDLDAAEALLDFIDAVDTRSGEIVAEEAALTERLTQARERAEKIDAPAAEEPVEPEPEPEPEPVAEEPEPVLAAGTRRQTVARAAAKAPVVLLDKKDEDAAPLLAITAAANVPEFTAGQNLSDMGEVASAFLSRASGFGQNDPKMKTGVYQMTPNASRHGVARIRRQDREFTVEREMSVDQQFAIIMEAARESRLPGGLIAAGGWCAPSETLYDFCELETTEGLLDIPEVTARRGGIQFTKGPDFGTLFADADFGFIQTEAQAEAGTTKPCYAVECPPFEEVRLDAIGFCITAGLLTNAGYPELVRRVLNLAAVGHARRKNASTISRISTLIGTAINWVEVGAAGSTSGVADTLDAVEFQALRIRQTNSMSPNATIEGIAPYWLRAAFRADLGRRNNGGLENVTVSDADVDRFFAVRGIRLQYVYDYQMLTTATTGTWTAYPTSVEIMLYPAGSYVRLVNDVISLDAVYDHDLLTTNTYTAAFMEEGIAIANTCGGGVKVAISLNYEGVTGHQSAVV